MRENRFIVALLGFISSAVLVIALKELRSIFIPLILAILMSLVLSPVIRILCRLKIPRVVAVVMVVLAIFFLFYLSGLFVYAGFNAFLRELPNYENSLKSTLDTSLQKVDPKIAQIQQFLLKNIWEKNLQTISVENTLSAALGSFLNFIGYVLLILVITIFILAGQFDLDKKLRIAFEPERAQTIANLVLNIQSKVQVYLLTKFFANALVAISSAIIIALFGVDFAIIAAVLFFTLEFIPKLGSIIATAFPLLIGFVQYGFSWKLPGLALCLIASQAVIGNVVEPLMMGRGLNLSPIVVILCLIFWGWVWGIVGMFLAVPLTSSFVLIFENIEPLRPIAVMLSGKEEPRKSKS